MGFLGVEGCACQRLESAAKGDSVQLEERAKAWPREAPTLQWQRRSYIGKGHWEGEAEM